MLSKAYADPSTGAAGTVGPDYAYTAGGRLKTRTWARTNSSSVRIVTTYKYGFDDSIFGNNYPDLTEISYNDSVTPTTTYDYDRRGRQTSVVRAGMTTTRSYSAAGQLLGEAYSGGSLSGLWATNTFDSLLRRTNLTARSSGATYVSTAYGYDQASRLQTVTDGTYGATYASLPNVSVWGSASIGSGPWR